MGIAVIVVGYGPEPLLAACLDAVLADLGPDDELVLVDNGITEPPTISGVRSIRSSKNGGYAAGCALGVDSTDRDVLVFLNSDAVLRPGAVASLAQACAVDGVGLATGKLLLADRPDRVNSAGNPVHLTGLSWAGGFGEPAAAHDTQGDVASVSGGLFACRRDVWAQLDGMDEGYFMYHEDTDLSLRCHLAGLRVVYCPDAVALHAYDFSRNSAKMYLLERNRFLTVLADFPNHLLLRVLPVIVLLEPMYLAIALRDGWGREKVRSWGWLLRHTGTVRARRRRVQAQVRDAHALDALLSPVVTQTQLDPPRALTLLNRVLTRYWRAARPALGPN